MASLAAFGARACALEKARWEAPEAQDRGAMQRGLSAAQQAKTANSEELTQEVELILNFVVVL